MPMGECDPNRVVLEVSGEDRVSFLQGLVTADVRRVESACVYAALLTPQGKYLADFFLVAGGEGVILLDAHESLALDLERRLSLYRLRAKVAIARSALKVQRGLGPTPQGAFADPRDPSLGWRAYGVEEGAAPTIDWDALRVAACIPESGIELQPNETYILEAGFERMQGVDFRKGCYVGQEVTARMHHKTELRKGFRTVDVIGEAGFGDMVKLGEKAVGTLYTRAGNQAIAYLRLDMVGPGMTAGEATVSL